MHGAVRRWSTASSFQITVCLFVSAAPVTWTRMVFAALWHSEIHQKQWYSSTETLCSFYTAEESRKPNKALERWKKDLKKSACSKPRQHSNIHIDTREKESLKKPRGGTTNHLVVLWDMRRSSEETYSTSFISHCITWGYTWTPTHLSAMKTSNTHICFLISRLL